MPARWLRAFWREILVAALLALPILSLLPLGVLWLIQVQGALIWAGIMLGSVAIAALLLWLHQPPEATPSLMSDDKGEPVWGDREKAVWQQVKQFADSTPPHSMASQEQVVMVMRATVELVAGALHPDAKTPIGRFTIPEALLALEQISRALRTDLLKRVPMAHKLRISDVMWVADHWDSILVLQQIWTVFRLARLVVGPAVAVTSEARAWLWNTLKSQGTERAQALLMRVLIQEVGRAAINLYSGRFRLNTDEIQKLVAEESARLLPSPPPVPVRILLAGQVNAGKSSLLNALAGEARAPVDSLPTPAGFQLFQLERDGQPAVTMIDSPGLDGGPEPLRALRQQVLTCDLLLWVAAANQPARAADVLALGDLRAMFDQRQDRRAPPIVLVVTHIDQLRPAREWTPPYDIANPAVPKAQSIRAALNAITETLRLADAIPVAVAEGTAPYNLDLVWARISVLLPRAQQTQLNRLMTDGRDAWDVERILNQAYHGGRALFAELFK